MAEQPHLEPFIAHLDPDNQLENQLQQLVTKLDFHYRVFSIAVADAYRYASVPVEQIVFEKFQSGEQASPIKRLNVACINITRVIGSFSFLLIPRGQTHRPLPPFWYTYTKEILSKIPVLFRYALRLSHSPPSAQYHHLHLSSMSISSLGLINILLIAAQVQEIDSDYEQCLILVHSILKELVICCIPDPMTTFLRPPQVKRIKSKSQSITHSSTPTASKIDSDKVPPQNAPKTSKLSSFKNKISSKIETKLAQLKSSDNISPTLTRTTTTTTTSLQSNNLEITTSSSRNSRFFSPNSPTRTPSTTVLSTTNESRVNLNTFLHDLPNSSSPHTINKNITATSSIILPISRRSSSFSLSSRNDTADHLDEWDDDLIVLDSRPRSSKVLQIMHSTVLTQLCTNLKLLLSDKVLSTIELRGLIDYHKNETFYLNQLPLFMTLVLDTLLTFPIENTPGSDINKSVLLAWKGNFNIIGSIIGIARFYSHFNANIITDTTLGDRTLGIFHEIQDVPFAHPQPIHIGQFLEQSPQPPVQPNILNSDTDGNEDGTDQVESGVLTTSAQHLYKSTDTNEQQPDNIPMNFLNHHIDNEPINTTYDAVQPILEHLSPSTPLTISDSILLDSIETQLNGIIRQQHSHLYVKQTFYINIFENFILSHLPRIIAFIKFILLALHQLELDRQKLPEYSTHYQSVSYVTPIIGIIEPNNFLSTHIELLDTSHEYDYINFDIEYDVNDDFNPQGMQQFNPQQHQPPQEVQREQNRIHARLEEPHQHLIHQRHQHQPVSNAQRDHTARLISRARIFSLYQMVTELILTLFSSINDYTNYINSRPRNIQPQSILQQFTRNHISKLLGPHFYNLYMAGIFSYIVPVQTHVERPHRLFFEQLKRLHYMMLPSLQEINLYTIPNRDTTCSHCVSHSTSVFEANYQNITFWNQIINEYLLAHFTLSSKYETKQFTDAGLLAVPSTYLSTPLSLRNSCSVIDSILSNSTTAALAIDLHLQHDVDNVLEFSPIPLLARYQSTSPLPSTHPIFGIGYAHQHLLTQSDTFTTLSSKLQFEQLLLTNKFSLYSHLFSALHYLQQSYKIEPYIQLKSSTYLDYQSAHAVMLSSRPFRSLQFTPTQQQQQQLSSVPILTFFRNTNITLSDHELELYEQWFKPNWSNIFFIETFNNVKLFPPHLYLNDDDDDNQPFTTLDSSSTLPFNDLPATNAGKQLYLQRIQFIESLRSPVIHRRQLFYSLEAFKLQPTQLPLDDTTTTNLNSISTNIDLTPVLNYHYNVTPNGQCDWAVSLDQFTLKRCASLFTNSYQTFRQIIANLAEDTATKIYESLQPLSSLSVNSPSNPSTILLLYSDAWINLLLYHNFGKTLQHHLTCYPWSLIQPGVVSDYDLLVHFGELLFDNLGFDLDDDNDDGFVVIEDAIPFNNINNDQNGHINHHDQTTVLNNHGLDPLSPLLYKEQPRGVGDEIDFIYSLLPSLSYLFTSQNAINDPSITTPSICLFVELLNRCLFGLAHTMCDLSTVNNTHMLQQPLEQPSRPQFLSSIHKKSFITHSNASSTIIASNSIHEKQRSNHSHHDHHLFNSHMPPARTSLLDFYLSVSSEPLCFQYNSTRTSFDFRETPINISLYHPNYRSHDLSSKSFPLVAIPIPFEFTARTVQFVIELFIDLLESDSDFIDNQLSTIDLTSSSCIPLASQSQYQPLHQSQLVYPSYPQQFSKTVSLPQHRFPHPTTAKFPTSHHLPFVLQSLNSTSTLLSFLSDFSITNLYQTPGPQYDTSQLLSTMISDSEQPQLKSSSRQTIPIKPTIDLLPPHPGSVPFRTILDAINDGLIE